MLSLSKGLSRNILVPVVFVVFLISSGISANSSSGAPNSIATARASTQCGYPTIKELVLIRSPDHRARSHAPSHWHSRLRRQIVWHILLSADCNFWNQSSIKKTTASRIFTAYPFFLVEGPWLWTKAGSFPAQLRSKIGKGLANVFRLLGFHLEKQGLAMGRSKSLSKVLGKQVAFYAHPLWSKISWKSIQIGRNPRWPSQKLVEKECLQPNWSGYSKKRSLTLKACFQEHDQWVSTNFSKIQIIRYWRNPGLKVADDHDQERQKADQTQYQTLPYAHYH